MKQLKRLVIIVGAIYFIFGLVVFIFQRKFIYFPTSQNFNTCADLPNATPVTFEGTRMYVHKTTADWIIIYHGNAGSACDRSYYLNYFDSKKYSYIIVEYTGYSNDQESPSQTALMKNVEAVNKYLTLQNPSTRIVIGESLGTGLAAYHYFLNPTNKLVLISAYDSLPNVSQSQFWFYPTKLMLLDKYPSEKWLKDANNLTIIHGLNDKTIPIRLGRSLFNKISGQNNKFVEIPGAGHNDIYDYEQTFTTIKDLLK